MNVLKPVRIYIKAAKIPGFKAVCNKCNPPRTFFGLNKDLVENNFMRHQEHHGFFSLERRRSEHPGKGASSKPHKEEVNRRRKRHKPKPARENPSRVPIVEAPLRLGVNS